MTPLPPKYSKPGPHGLVIPEPPGPGKLPVPLSLGPFSPAGHRPGEEGLQGQRVCPSGTWPPCPGPSPAAGCVLGVGRGEDGAEGARTHAKDRCGLAASALCDVCLRVLQSFASRARTLEWGLIQC